MNRFLVVTGVIDVVQYDDTGATVACRTRLAAGDMADVPAGTVHRFEVVESGIVVEVYWVAASVRVDDIERIDTGGKNT